MSKPNSDAVAERRLRPIYDWLDVGNNKKAIQEADKVLKKQPDLLCAKVLKGLALLRLGKSKDCEDILEGVKQEAPADDCTLQAMTICYREIHKLDNICDVYEKAVLKDPQNEELNTHLFMSYVRISDFRKQQQVALNLYKLKPKNPYYFWGVMSILMQAQNSDDNIAQQIRLPLAERMVKKFIDEGKIEAEQEVQLYIMILEMQKNYEEALNVIDSELGRKLLSNFSRLRKRIKLLEKLEIWQNLNIYCKKLLLEEPDAYGFYVKYIDSVFSLLKKENNSNDTKNLNGSSCDNIIEPLENQIISPDCTIESCVAFIERCQQQTKIPHRLRGPHLAMIFLCKRLLEKGYNPSKYLGGTPLDLFKTYFELFADKPCCFKDLQPFFPLVQAEYVHLLSATLSLIKNSDDEEVKNKKQMMMMYLTHFQMSRYSATYETLSINEKFTQISKLLDFYHDGHRFNADLTSTDLGCSDTFLILAVHSLHDLYLDTNDLKFLKDAVCLLEYGYGLSPSNHHFKLLLLKFYNMLGATKVGYKYFHLLEIKHMQYDSLGYLACWALLYSGQYSFAVSLLDNTLKFFNINYKEAADQLTHAYKYGSFEKVIEFLNFRERLKNSFHYSLVTIEHLINDLIHLPSHEITIQSAQQLSINPEKPIADSNHLVDNRDLCLFLNFDSDSRRMNEEYAKLSFEHEVKLIRLRTMLLRCIGASINVCLYASPSKNNQNNTDNNHTQRNGLDDSYVKHLDIFLNVIQELKDMHSTLLGIDLQEIPKNVFSGVEPSRLFLYAKTPFFFPMFIDAMTFAHDFYKHCLSDNASIEVLEKTAATSANLFVRLVSDCGERVTSIQSSFNEISHREIFEYFSLAVEMVCVVSIICGNMRAMLTVSSKKAATPARKKKRKGKETAMIDSKNKEPTEEGVLKIYNYYLNIVRDNAKALEIHFSLLESCWEKLETHKPGFKLRGYLTQNSVELENSPGVGISDQKWEEIQSEVNKNISDSFSSSIKQFKNVVKHKTDYLALLSF